MSVALSLLAGALSERPTTIAPVTPSRVWTLSAHYVAEITGGVVLRIPALTPISNLPEVPPCPMP